MQITAGNVGVPYRVAHCKRVRRAGERRTLDLGWVAANHPGHHCMVLEVEEPAHGHSWVEEEIVIVGVVGSLRKLEVFLRSAKAGDFNGGDLTDTAAEADKSVLGDRNLAEVVRSLAEGIHIPVEVVGHSLVAGEDSRRVAGLPGIADLGRTWLSRPLSGLLKVRSSLLRSTGARDSQSKNCRAQAWRGKGVCRWTVWNKRMVIGDPHSDQFGEDRGTKVKNRKKECSRKRSGTLLMMYSHRNTNEIAGNNRTTYLEDIFRGPRGRKDTGFLCTASSSD